MEKQQPSPRRGRLYLKQWRKRRGLTQEALADRIGITPPTLSRIETGKISYTANIVAAVAEALDIDADALFRDPAAPEADVIDLIGRMTPDARRRAAAILRALIETEKAG